MVLLAGDLTDTGQPEEARVLARELSMLRVPGVGGVFNIGSGAETTVAELHELCRTVSGDGRPPRLDPAREGDVLRSVLDVGRAERELAWRPKIPLDEGLRLTWDWVQTR